VASNNVPENDTLARYVKPSHILADPISGKIGLFTDAFKLRPDERDLSASWIEYYSGMNRAEQIAATITAFKSAISVKKSAAFALGNVGKIKAACSRYSVNVRVLHEPDPPHLPGHVAIHRYRDDDAELLSLLADTIWSEVVPANSTS